MAPPLSYARDRCSSKVKFLRSLLERPAVQYSTYASYLRVPLASIREMPCPCPGQPAVQPRPTCPPALSLPGMKGKERKALENAHAILLGTNGTARREDNLVKYSIAWPAGRSDLMRIARYVFNIDGDLHYLPTISVQTEAAERGYSTRGLACILKSRARG